MAMGTYTENRKDDLEFEVSLLYDGEEDYSYLLDIINNNFFRPFADRLLYFFAEKRGLTVPETADEQDALRNRLYNELLHELQTIGSSTTRNTVKDWFYKKTSDGPKMGAGGRQKMYEIAFALKLSPKETAQLFKRVYLDRAFVMRNAEEYVYYYCLKNRKSYAEAKAMIEEVQKLQKTSGTEKTELETHFMQEFADSTSDAEAIIDYIASNPQEFNNDNRTGKKRLELYWSKITGSREEEGLAKKYYKLLSEYRLDDDKLSDDAPKSFQSTDFALDMMIYGFKGATRSKDIKKPKDVFKLHEIVTMFPDANSILNTESAYALRKNLILVYFFWYWTKAMIARKENRIDLSIGFEGFVDELNSILFECGYSDLYYGNPYDWLFLYCAKCWDPENEWMCNNPIEIFHGITSTE